MKGLVGHICLVGHERDKYNFKVSIMIHFKCHFTATTLLLMLNVKYKSHNNTYVILTIFHEVKVILTLRQSDWNDEFFISSSTTIMTLSCFHLKRTRISVESPPRLIFFFQEKKSRVPVED